MMQSLADSEYTPKTGVKIDFQIMPDESKLLLASASGEAPDAALGVSVGIPYNLALRGAVLKLNDLPDFKQTAQQFSPGAMIPMIIDNNFYGLPETQDFYVQFTRNDILDKLNIPAANTWNDVTSSLPELQRYGMNYYIPLSGTAGTKAMMFTAQGIWQANGSLYNPNGTQSAINSANGIQGLTFMTQLYTTYSLPLQVNSFYNSFRYGQLPAGISNFGSYVQLKSAAPEIANEWSIEPSPGVQQADGSINRMQTGSHTEDFIFKSTKNKAETWKFLQWWESSQTQSDYARQLQTTYGPSYMWNTANLTAFAQLPWPEADKTAILEQWKWLEEAPQTPAGYMEERQISNIWTDVVFNGKNVRAATENNSIIINKEITSRLSDFGYIKNGKLVKNYEIPTLDKVKELLDEK
jgi:ABC-type glycerol-3-phosphate transport system substrate-binding protein